MVELKEGLIGGGLNLYFIYKFLRILTTPWEKSEAFKLGIVDDNGKILKKKRVLKTAEEKEAYTMMHRLVWKLKRLMEKVPFGKTRLASYAAALWLIKEENDFDGTDNELQESFLSFLETEWENDALILKENYEGDIDKKTFGQLREYVPSFKVLAQPVKDVYKILSKKDWVLKQPMGDDRVIKLLKKYDDPKKVADEIMKKHPLLKDEEVEIDEKVKPAKDVGLECMECGHKFLHKNPKYGITKCPKCKSTDLDLQFGEEVKVDEVKSDYEDAIAAFKAKGGNVKKLKPGKKFKSLFKQKGPKKLPRQAEETEKVEISEGRPKIVDPDAVRAGDEEKQLRVAAQQKIYKPEEVANIARKHKVRLDGEPAGGKSWGGDWEISLRGGITLDYDYRNNETTIKGWKVDRNTYGKSR